MKAPQLAAWDNARNNLKEIRPLTDEEVQSDIALRDKFTEAQNRLKLFQILELNYREWAAHQRKFIAPGPRKEDDHLIFDRLLFNFLSSAYGVIEHFEVSYKQRYRKDQAKLAEYKSFLSNFCETSWASAFFMDFRNYAQHFALPIGNCSRNESTHSIKISITHNAAQLVDEYSGWKWSRLTAEHGDLDLISLTEEYFQRLRIDYAAFVVKYFYPELKDIDAFYWRLTQEVRETYPGARMVFMTEKEEKKDRARISFRWSFEQPPNYVFEELGLSHAR